MKEAVEEGKAVEERMGRRYKEGDQMVEGGIIFGDYFGREFLQKNRGKKVMEERGNKTRGGG